MACHEVHWSRPTPKSAAQYHGTVLSAATSPPGARTRAGSVVSPSSAVSHSVYSVMSALYLAR